MITIGHRGCAGQYPENTITAVQECGSHVDMIEIDVMRCGSGELIAFHDASLKRVTGVDAPVAETDWTTIRNLKVLDTSATIPRLENMLAAWPDNVGVNLDIHAAGIAPEALPMAAEHVDDILLSTTERAVLQEFDESPVDGLSGYSFQQNIGANIDRAASMDCDYVHVPYQFCLETDIVETAHNIGIAVGAWTVASADTFVDLRESEVDAVTVDRWDIC